MRRQGGPRHVGKAVQLLHDDILIFKDFSIVFKDFLEDSDKFLALLDLRIVFFIRNFFLFAHAYKFTLKNTDKANFPE